MAFVSIYHSSWISYLFNRNILLCFVSSFTPRISARVLRLFPGCVQTVDDLSNVDRSRCSPLDRERVNVPFVHAPHNNDRNTRSASPVRLRLARVWRGFYGRLLISTQLQPIMSNNETYRQKSRMVASISWHVDSIVLLEDFETSKGEQAPPMNISSSAYTPTERIANI